MPKNRSLSQANHRILRNSQILESTLTSLLESSQLIDGALNVLEVGFGHGRALTELAWRFRDEPVSFLGVDRKERGVERLRSLAREYKILPEGDVPGFRFPKTFAYDATQLHFEDSSIDLLYSTVTIRFIERKAEFVEEVSRVLRPGGVALLHIGESDWDYPYSTVCDDRVLTPYTTRFVLKYRNELIPLAVYLESVRSEAFQCEFINRPCCVLRLRKLRPGKLELGLHLNQDLTLSMRELPYRKESGSSRGGIRSVYDVPEANYQALLERGLVSRDRLREDIQLGADHENGIFRKQEIS